MDSNLVASISEYKKRLEKGVGVEKTLHILRKLERFPFTVDLLKETGIGKVVRKISKENDGDVRDKAKHLCNEWRRLVRETPDGEADVKVSEMPTLNKVKLERDESLRKVNKYEHSAVNGVTKKSGGYDPEINWSMKSVTKSESKEKSAAGNDEKCGIKADRRLPTVSEVKEAAQRINGAPRVASNSNSDNRMLGVTSRKVRTTVYSGHARSTQYTHVLSLEDLCLRVLMDHIDNITYLGSVPYYLMKPVLKKCTPTQLFKIEDYNPCYVDEDDELWFEHCQSMFKDCEPEEHESWRELYIRCQMEREAKLKMISGKINKSQQQSGPARKTLLFETHCIKGPKHVQRLQQKFGTAAPVHFPERGSAGAKANIAAMRAAAKESTSSSKASNPPKKAKTAPLMAKSIQLMKTRFRR